MLRSLMTTVTSVKAHQTMLDVTGNNIANVNTTGYKKNFTIFQDLLYQTTQGASGPGDNRGGINPSQVGLGVTVASIETIHSQGPALGNKFCTSHFFHHNMLYPPFIMQFLVYLYILK